jgi:sortase A
MKIKLHWRRYRGSAARRFLRPAEVVFLLVGLLALGYVAVIYSEAGLYQAYQHWKFNRSLNSVPPPAAKAERPGRRTVPDGSPFGRLDIPRLGISVMVVEGVEPDVLELGVGHVPGTAFPGEDGNVGIAGHRDTFFRKLRKIRVGDEIRIATLRGSYDYSVESKRVVAPGEVEVLQASNQPALTLVTCYPFYYVGPAPNRFIVRARQSRR